MNVDPISVVRRMYEAGNQRDYDAVREIFAPDFYSHPLQETGVETVLKNWRTAFGLFPEMRLTPQRMIVQGDRVAVWSKIENVTGQPELMELIRVADGRVAELWGLSNLAWRRAPRASG